MAVNNYFLERRNQFHKSTYQKLFRSNPFRSLVPVSAFDLSEGRTPTVRTLTHELPTAYPTSMITSSGSTGGSGTTVGISDGSGNALCNPTTTTIKRGEESRTFELFAAAFRTDTVCLSDLKRAHDAASTVAGFERALNEYISVYWSDWYRLQNIKMVDNKACTRGSGVVETVTSTRVNHTELTNVPNADLSWDHLRQIYWDLARNGLADELAVGRDSKGRPVLPLYAGVGIINNLWAQVGSDTREQVKFFDSARNIQHLGFDGAVYGFLPIVDLFPIRYGKSTAITAVADLTTTNMVYPTANANAGATGRKYTSNANYKLRAKGGQVDFEVCTILGRDVYEAKFEAADPSSFSGMNFNPVNYTAEFNWINNRTFEGENDLGNQGYYRADIRLAAKPIYPELGYSIVTLARDV